MSTMFWVALALFCLYVNAQAAPTATPLGVINIKDPAFVSAVPSLTGDKTLTLLISTFGLLGTFGVSAVYDIGSQLHNLNKTKPTMITTSPWPNVVTMVDPKIFGQTVMAIPSGFLVPTKSTGAITLLTNPGTSSATSVKISVDDSGFFYHNVTWVDMNGDGRLDILTARGSKPLIGASKGNLVWFEQPASNPLGGKAWTPHQMMDGPDVFIALFDVNGDGVDELFAAEFFASKLVMYYRPNGGFWANATIKSVVIDAKVGALFDLMFTDVNGDGKPELLVTNHVNTANLSGVYAYEIPKDYINTPWPRHTLANGFVTLATGSGSASPGNAITFQPCTSTKGKPLIAVAGDGAKAAYVLTPNSQDANNWQYTVTTIYKGSSTVGQVSARDVDGDGCTELFVALYDSAQVLVLTYGNSAQYLGPNKISA